MHLSRYEFSLAMSCSSLLLPGRRQLEGPVARHVVMQEAFASPPSPSHLTVQHQRVRHRAELGKILRVGLTFST